MAVQSRMRPFLRDLLSAEQSRLIQFGIFYSRHYNGIQRVLRYVYLFSLVWGLVSMFQPRKRSAKKTAALAHKNKSLPNKPKRVAVDDEFFRRLKRLLCISFPGWRSKETFLLGKLSFVLVLRTIISLYVAELDGRIVASLVRGDVRTFFFRVLMWMGIAVPAVLSNSLISFFSSSLSLAVRSRLSSFIQHEYMRNLKFYKLSNLDDRIRNADQMIAVDIPKFSSALVRLYGNVALPLVDVLLYNYRLSTRVGVEMLIFTTTVIRLTSMLVQKLTPPFGQYAATEQQLEGEYRFQHARLIENAEEVAFFRGQELEKRLLDRSYFSLIKHVNHVFHIRISHGMMEEGVIKWLWGAIGLVICSAPVFFRVPGLNFGGGGLDMGSRTEMFVTNRRLLLSSSDATGRIMYSYKELSELAGFTTRLTSLIEVMDDIEHGKFAKNLLSSGSEKDLERKEDTFSHRGKLIENKKEVVFDKVPIVSPNGDILLESLSFHISPGQNLLIIGPNGCGKSSMFRILGGLWPVYGGEVRKPSKEEFTYIPQRPYLSLGTLREQIIYPDTVEEMHAKGATDEQLMDILKIVQISNIVEREGGWDVKREWRDALSGGDKQRIAMARLFYHKPKYAILDECTSAVTLEVEQIMYEHAMKLGITMLTVSHRPSLWKYHKYVLQYDGQGGYVFTELDADKRLQLQEEKQQLEQKLLLLPKWQERLDDLRGIAAERIRNMAAAKFNTGPENASIHHTEASNAEKPTEQNRVYASAPTDQAAEPSAHDSSVSAQEADKPAPPIDFASIQNQTP